MKKIKEISMILAAMSMAWPVQSAVHKSLEDITVTATRTEKDSLVVPQHISTYSANMMRTERSPRTITEALKEDPGILSQKTAHGQGSPFIRGFTGFRNLMLVDGIRLNNSVFRDGPNQYWNTVDSMMVSRMELVKGPSSVLYGSDSVGGTVQVFSHEREYSAEKRPWETGLYGRVASAEQSQLGRLDVSGDINQHLGLWLGGTVRNYGDLRAGDPTGEQRGTAYDEGSLDTKLSYHIDADSRFVLAHQNLTQDDAWRTHATAFSTSYEGTALGTDAVRFLDQDRRLTYLQYHQKNAGSWYDALHASISLHEQDEVEFRERVTGGAQRREIQEFQVDTTGLSLQLENLSRMGTWTYGGEFYHDDVDASKREWNLPANTPRGPFIQGAVADDATYDSSGVFVQNDINLSRKWELITGVRYSATDLHAGAVEDPVSKKQISIDDKTQALLGNMRLCYFPQDEWNVFAGVAQSFRAPNLSDLTRFDIARTSETETPVPGGLDPERYLTYETGAKYRDDKNEVGLTYYYTVISDMIVRTPTGNRIGNTFEVTKKNSGDGYSTGVEFDLRRKLNREYTCSVMSAWMIGEVDSYPNSSTTLQKDYLTRILPWTTVIGLKHQLPDSRWWWETLLTLAQKQDKLSAGDKADTQRIPPGGSPGYEVFTLRSGFQFSSHLDATATLENITDKDYRIHGSGINEPGFNAILGMQAKF